MGRAAKRHDINTAATAERQDQDMITKPVSYGIETHSACTDSTQSDATRTEDTTRSYERRKRTTINTASNRGEAAPDMITKPRAME
jgi:hypothetical protein